MRDANQRHCVSLTPTRRPTNDIRRREEERGLAHNGGKGVAAVAVAEDISYLVTILENRFVSRFSLHCLHFWLSLDLVIWFPRARGTAAASSRTTGTSSGGGDTCAF